MCDKSESTVGDYERFYDVDIDSKSVEPEKVIFLFTHTNLYYVTLIHNQHISSFK